MFVDKKESSIISLNLDLEKIDENVLSEIIFDAEEIIRQYIVKEVGDKLVSDLNITIIVDKNDKITFTIDVAFSAPKFLEMEYDNIIDNAIRNAAKVIEERLMMYVKK
ncbi:MAG: hypothetical protein DRO23_01295 [Thermoprotei archaeon]|nr:MAG: hypothetical protein DRO23_01295 [Thermoprotei archaeon]